jgi:sialidase-1
MDNDRYVHPLCHQLLIEKDGPFLNLQEGGLMTVVQNGVSISKDDGKTWSKPCFVSDGITGLRGGKEPATVYIVQTKSGAMVMVYLNSTVFRFSWDEEKGEPKDCCLEVWAVRSLDGGKTWIDNQRILDGYNANFFGFIQTSKGRLVATVEHLVSNPGHWVSCSLLSDDDGKTWKRSNFIDIGGHGHHDGATEPTVTELSDGKLLMLIRTNLDRFWQSISTDGGRYWRIIQPSDIDSSSSPGYLLRLNSGRLALVWNRLNPEGGICEKTKPNSASEVDTSWYREELSIAFSDNDAKTWTKPVVIGRQKGGQLSYPYVFERRLGEIWITAGFAHKIRWKKEAEAFRVKIYEEEFLQAIKDV